MKSKVYFEEEQKLDAWWVKFGMVLLLSVSLGPVYYGLIQQIGRGIPWGDKPMSDTGFIIFTVVLTLLMAVVAFLVFASKLNTSVRHDGIHLSFFPFFKKRVIAKDRIERFEVRKYRPIMEYGGYGLRYSLRNGRAYNMKGNTGLQLYLVDGKKILVGTQRSDAIKRAMEKMMSE